MSVEDLVSFLAAKRPTSPLPPRPVASRRPTGDEIRARLGPGAEVDDLKHAVLVVREAPRLGARLMPTDDRLRRYLETQQLRPRAPTGRIVFATDHFLMDALTEPDSERFSPVYNFATPFVQSSSSSGRSARIYQYQGSLLASAVEGSAYAAFRAGWDDWLRVSALVGGEARRTIPYVAELTYRDQIRRGYPVAVQFDRAAQHPSRVGLGLSLFVVHEASRDPEPPRVTTPVGELDRRVNEAVRPAPDRAPPVSQEFFA